ncbi:MAG: CoA transferase [Acidimicrobiales bacterium]|nr:CoA transferase [Acidimicrobiales bacterium]
MTSLLDTVRVLDLTDAYGALAARVLAELGAEVVRVEAPGGGRGPTVEPVPGAAGLHHAHRNVGKTVVRSDPAQDGSLDAVEQALAGADVVIVARDGWAAPEDGLAAFAIAERHPHLVVVSLTPFGLTGPAAQWRTTELVEQALAGVVYRSGVPELPPVAAPGSYSEDLGAVTGAMAAMIALHHARRTGQGQVVDVSSILSLAHVTETSLPLWSQLGMHQTRNGAGLYPLFECTDGLARIVLPMTPADWRSLIAWLGSPPEWSGPEWEQPMLAPTERDLVLERLPGRFAPHTRDAVTHDAEAAGVRVTPVLRPDEVLTNEHVTERATFTPLELPDGQVGSVFAGFYGVDGQRAAIGGWRTPVGEFPQWSRRDRADDGAPSAAPLAGIRVLELGTGIAAPEAGRMLAEWGADVIKVESRVRPDFQRRVLGSDMNPAFASPNRSKRLLGADLSNPAGRELVERLLPQVDIVLENNAAGVLDRLGLGWEVMKAANPRIVLVSSQLYGDRGPWSWRKGYGPSARAVGGLTWLWAHGPDAPRGVMTIHPDHFAGRLGALGAVAALLARERTGVGCHIDIAQFEAVSGLLGDVLLAEGRSPGSAVPQGNRSAVHAPWGVYRCADDAEGREDWLAVCVTDDAGWRALLDVADGRVPDDPDWRSTAGRLARRDALDEAVGAWLAEEEAATVEGMLQAAGVAAGRLLHPAVQAVHPQYVARGYPVEVDQPGSGRLVFEGPAFDTSVSGRPRCGPAPLPGEHTRAVLTELLGIGDAEIARLVDVGAIDDC